MAAVWCDVAVAVVVWAVWCQRSAELCCGLLVVRVLSALRVPDLDVDAHRQRGDGALRGVVGNPGVGSYWSLVFHMALVGHRRSSFRVLPALRFRLRSVCLSGPAKFSRHLEWGGHEVYLGSSNGA